MKKLIYLSVILFTINIYCQESDSDILKKTIAQLNNIETVLYQSKKESIESGVKYLESDFSIFFDFRNANTTPKYYIKQGDSELIFDGQRHIQTLHNEKLILINNKPNVNNPLLLSFYPIKEFLPKMLENKNVRVLRKKDTTINNIKSYVFELNYKNGYLDFEKLILRDFPEANYQINYTLMVSKLNFLPTKMIMPNGSTGTISRAFYNLDFNYTPDEVLWTGKHFSSEYEKITFKEYFKRLEAKSTSKLNGDKNENNITKIKDWKIPNLKTDELVDFSIFDGNVVLLEFWFKFCGPCVKATPRLNSMNEKYKNNNFLMYGVEFREDFPRKNLQEYVSKIKMNYPVLYKGKDIANEYAIGAAPTIMIIDKKGNIVYLEAGFDHEKVKKIIEENL